VAKLEFLANMNISPLTVEQLRTQGWNITRVSEVMEKGSKDIDILLYAQKQNKIVITQDLDFSTLLALRGYIKPSVINLRLENPKPGLVSARIIDVVSMMEKELEEGVVITIDETSARYRNLPIRLE
jgi:predicted nuclease of predicted toxin-antitoxin system